MVGSYDTMMILWSIIMWAVLLAIIIKVMLMYTRAFRKGSSEEEYLTSILKARYARGEISKEEFEQKKRDLGL